jgi:sugar phosphate isomerase/epimerase
MVQLAFSTNAFKQSSLEQAIDAIASAGYAGIELMADVPHLYPPKYTSDDRQRVRQHLAHRNLIVSNINAFTHFADGDTYHPTWIEEDPTLIKKRVGHTLNCIDLAAEFGAATVSLQPGGALIGTTLTPDEAMERFAQSLRPCVERASQRGVILAIEPEPGLLLQTSQEYETFKRRYFDEEPTIRMNCDIGHLFCVGEDPADVIRGLPEEIVHVHLEDIGSNRVHQHLAPGKGAIDFARVFQALDDISYRGWVTVELYPYEAAADQVARDAIAHLRPIIASM